VDFPDDLNKSMRVKGLARRVTAAAVAASLVVLVVCDLSIGSFQASELLE
jgi:hypothetical protein